MFDLQTCFLLFARHLQDQGMLMKLLHLQDHNHHLHLLLDLLLQGHLVLDLLLQVDLVLDMQLQRHLVLDLLLQGTKGHSLLQDLPLELQLLVIFLPVTQ